LVRKAAADGSALYPLGGQTMLGVGYTPSRPGVGVDLRSLDRMIDYPARDMTITVEAGITLKKLQEVLAAEHQRLPIDVPRADQATLGGSLAVNVSGCRRYGFGTLRDYVIGISAVNDQGHEVKAGGRVVKNVAGYDLCKLHIGALGTLGIITQVTLKLRPVPDGRALMTLGCNTEELSALLDQLHTTRTRPVCIDVLNRSAVRALERSQLHLPDSPWVIVIGFEESEPCVNWQVQQVLHEVPADKVHGLEARAGSACQRLWQALAESPLQEEARLRFKANLLPSAVADFCGLADRAKVPEIRLHAHAGSGIVTGQLGASLTLEQASAMLEKLSDLARQAQGNLVVPLCPSEWKRVLPVWGRPRGDAELMRQVIHALDPRRLFNPGRYLNGI
jgi:glycolate oxidase FAD binding subunit